MIRVCVDCGEIYGEKEPYEDKSYTHGYCPRCYAKAIELLEKQIAQKKRQNQPIPIKIRHCKEADSDHKKRKRHYAHTHHYPGTICIARAFYSLPGPHLYGILVHEIGHILGGKSQKAADRLGGERFGVRIKYADTPYGNKLEYISPREIKRVRSTIRSIH